MTAKESKSLLSIIELGGYPDFTNLYQQAGFDVVKAVSTRKALVLIKQIRPDVIVSEFIYAPTYGARISNLESLFAGIQMVRPDTKLIVLLYKVDLHHLESLKSRFPLFDILFFPIQESMLRKTIERAASEF